MLDSLSSQVLLCHHWEGLSRFCTIKQLLELLRSSSINESLENFERCKNAVHLNCFNFMLQESFQRIAQGWTIRQIWEDYLAVEGCIPKLIEGQIITNSRFFSLENNEEWNIVNTQGMRLYWNSMLCWRLDDSHNSKLYFEFQKIFQQYLNLLPGMKEQCHECQFWLPRGEMQKETMCSYCHDNKDQKNKKDGKCYRLHIYETSPVVIKSY